MTHDETKTSRAIAIAERDENDCRLDFTTLEAVALGEALEELEGPKAKERKAATLKRGDKAPVRKNLHNGDKGRTREIIGKAIAIAERVAKCSAAALDFTCAVWTVRSSRSWKPRDDGRDQALPSWSTLGKRSCARQMTMSASAMSLARRYMNCVTGAAWANQPK